MTQRSQIYWLQFSRVMMDFITIILAFVSVSSMLIFDSTSPMDATTSEVKSSIAASFPRIVKRQAMPISPPSMASRIFSGLTSLEIETVLSKAATTIDFASGVQ